VRGQPALRALFLQRRVGYEQIMKDEQERILGLLLDGEKRSFDSLKVSSDVDSVQLQNDLKRLTDDGLIEQTVLPGEDQYMITAKGREAAKSVEVL
jgi:predicted transcriptional regulator